MMVYVTPMMLAFMISSSVTLRGRTVLPLTAHYIAPCHKAIEYSVHALYKIPLLLVYERFCSGYVFNPTTEIWYKYTKHDVISPTVRARLPPQHTLADAL